MWNLLVLLGLAWTVWWFLGQAGRRGRTPVRAVPHAEATPPLPVRPSAPMVAESVTTVLRRQVPPRDEPARSWLGGLPRLPEDVPWPRRVSYERPDEGERPLHFVAQVACADLPAELWGGLGPRTGWLVFFLDPNDGTPEEAGSHAVLHVDHLGPERPVPFDLGPVDDRVFTGGSYRWLPADEVPSVWRRWPVDVVAFANQVHERDGRSVVTPDGFAETLYDGEPVRAGFPAARPWTRGQAADALRALATAVQVPPVPPGREDAITRLRTDGGPGGLTLPPESLDPDADTDAVLQWLEGQREAVRLWQQQVVERCHASAHQLAVGEPDAPLSLAEWQSLQADFEDEAMTYHELVLRRDHASDSGEQRLRLREHRTAAALSTTASTTQQAVCEWLDPRRRTQLPPELLDEMAAAARRLPDNRPHRMGGYHDGVQSDAVPGPTEDLLLLQLTTDGAMDWCWGDTGAYYFRIRSDHLAAGDFTGVEMWLECH